MIQHELATLITFDLRDPRLAFVSVTRVQVSSDLRHANVYISSLDGKESEADVVAALRHASGFLRRELGKRIRIHTLPELHFHYDPSVENGNRISALIDKAIEADRHNAEEGGEGAKPDTDPAS